jgi:hypothetical protein
VVALIRYNVVLWRNGCQQQPSFIQHQLFDTNYLLNVLLLYENKNHMRHWKYKVNFRGGGGGAGAGNATINKVPTQIALTIRISDENGWE